MKKASKSQYSAPALEKGLDILEHLADQRRPRSQMEIAQALGRSQSEIYRMLACLEQRGYVQKETGNGHYGLSMRLYQLAHRHSHAAMLRQAALLPMDALTDDTAQSCHMSVQHGGELIVLIERIPSQQVCLTVGEGSTLPLSLSASGKVILSRMSDELTQKTLGKDDSYNSSSPKAKKALAAQIAQIRKRGYHMEKSAQTHSVVDIAVPVGVANTDTAAVIALPFVSSSTAEKKQGEAFLKAVRSCAEQIDQNLGIHT